MVGIFIMFKKFILFNLLVYNIIANEFYSISVCTTRDYEGATHCKNKIKTDAKTDIFIIQGDDLKFRTIYGRFSRKEEAQIFQKHVSLFVRKQIPFVQKFILSENTKLAEHFSIENLNVPINLLVEQNNFLPTSDISENLPALHTNSLETNNNTEANTSLQTSNSSIKQQDMLLFKKNDLSNADKSLEVKLEIESIKNDDNSASDIAKQIDIPKVADISLSNGDIQNQTVPNVDSNTTINNIPQNINNEITIDDSYVADTNNNNNTESLKIFSDINFDDCKPCKENIVQYEKIIVNVDSNTHKMKLQGKIKNNLINLKEYVVSTGRKNVKKPLGEGFIEGISLSPYYYPTDDTKEHFKKQGIILPAAIPPGNKYNFMGAAKINLSHVVNGKNTYRIHGTVREETIGTSESGGCIRMKNNEVVELAKILKYFIKNKRNSQLVNVILE